MLENIVEQRIRFGRLYDFYGGLLTAKQQNIMEQHFYNDLSLGEIAENCNISRQAVHDLLKRVEITLEKYEVKLGLLARDERQKQSLIKGRKLLASYIKETTSDTRLKAVEKILQDLEKGGR